MTKHTKTLDERIAYTLKGDNEIASAEIGELLADVEAAAKAADETASKAHREALDPTRIVDAKSVAATVAAAALQRDRYQAALPRLEERRKQIAEAEYYRSWAETRDEVQAQRDELVRELRERYPVLARELIEMVSKIAPTDAMIDQVNKGRPDGEHSLQQTECLARDVLNFGVANHGGLLSLTTELKLPKFKSDDNAYQYMWPQRVPSIAEQMARAGAFNVPYNPMYSPHWHEAIDERDRQRRAEHERAAKQSNELEAVRERRRQEEAQQENERRRREQGL
jgi:hypothetical protein